MHSLAAYSVASETARFLAGHGDREFRILRHGEGCSMLWWAVIRLAVKDLRFARRFEGRRRIARHDATRLRQIHASPPKEFFRSAWFMEICGHLAADPSVVLERCDLDRDGRDRDGAVALQLQLNRRDPALAVTTADKAQTTIG